MSCGVFGCWLFALARREYTAAWLLGYLPTFLILHVNLYFVKYQFTFSISGKASFVLVKHPCRTRRCRLPTFSYAIAKTFIPLRHIFVGQDFSLSACDRYSFYWHSLLERFYRNHAEILGSRLPLLPGTSPLSRHSLWRAGDALNYSFIIAPIVLFVKYQFV